jgi:hypothetical protein
MQVRAWMTLMLPVLFMAGPAWSDSDGYYCVGRDYLAYQFGLAAPPIASHHLYVIRFGGEQGISEPSIIELPQFQVQGMLCAESTVELEAYDGLYVVQLDSRRRPISYEMTRWERQLIRGRNTPSLGGYGFFIKGLEPERKFLMRDTSGHEFSIQIEPSVLMPEKCETEITSRLLELDIQGSIVRERAIFKGKAYFGDCGTDNDSDLTAHPQ